MKTKVLTTVLAVLLSTSASFGANLLKGKNSNFISNLEDAKESTLKIETWMIDESVWNVKLESGFTEDTDQTFEIELWMVHPAYWKNLTTEAEVSLILEKWMTEDSYWNVSKPYLTTEKDKALQIEGWMIDDENWE